MFLDYICLYCVEPMVMSFLRRESIHPVNLNCLGCGGSVSGVPQGRDRRNSGFSFPFLVPLLALFYPQLMLSFLVTDFQGGCCPPCLPTLVFTPPCLQPLSTFGESVAGWWPGQGAWAHLSPEEDSQKSICLKGEFLLFNNGHQANQKETGIFSISWCRPVLPKTFHQGLTSAGEFVTKYLLTTISCY